MIHLAFRNLLRQKVRTALTLGAIAFGGAGIILSGGFVEDIFFQLREATIHSQLGHVQVFHAGYSSFGRRAPFQYLIRDPAALMEKLGKMPHVHEVLPRIYFAGLLGNGRANFSVVGEGVDPEKETRLGDYAPSWAWRTAAHVRQRAVMILAGRHLRAEDAHGILLGEGVASSLKLRPGDSATILLNTPEGALNSLDFTVVGIFRTYSKDYDDRAVRIGIEAAQELVSTSGVHSLVLLLDQTEATEETAAALRAELPPWEFEIQTWSQLADFYQKTVALYRRQFGVLQLITLIMVLLTVANSVNMTIFERVGEMGTLRALGNRNREVLRLIVWENAVLGLLGGLAGVALGAAIAFGISALGIPMPPPPNADSGYVAYIRIVPAVLVEAFAAGFLATVLAAILPAFRAARLPVAEALRQA
ncbi:MAG TPA: FtsX-like permease family protein [Thermoanaerobaculia bacterium]